MTGARSALIALAAALSACTTPTIQPPAPATSPRPTVPMPRVNTPFEQELRQRALVQGRQGRLADAAISWELLGVLRPDDPEARDRLNETRASIDAALPERLQRGAQALKRGELDAAAAHYLAALALQPDHAQAADALRTIERERNRRSVLRRPQRLLPAPRPTAGPAPPPLAGRPATGAVDRNELEHASLLGTQGDFDGAIALIEHHLASDRRDAAACRLLADAYLQKGEKLLSRDRAAAIASFEQSLRVDASNRRAAARLIQLDGRASAAQRPAGQQPAANNACAAGR